MVPAEYFRAGVGAVILDTDGRAMTFKRTDVEDAWQLPQGGMELGEQPEAAVWREIREETGLTVTDLDMLDAFPEPLVYELPPDLRSPKTGRGQVQYWFFFRIRHPGLPTVPSGEFSHVAWRSLDDVISGAAQFRRRIYLRLHDYAEAQRLLGP